MFTKVVDSPCGKLSIIGNEDGVQELFFGEKQETKGAPPKCIKDCADQLEKYFKGELKDFTCKINPKGTKFQCAVWEELRTVPYGETVSYGDLAKMVGNPRGCRAVAMCMKRNPIPIIQPCHRVIASDGSIGGFSCGLDNKKILFKIEGIKIEKE